MSVCSISCSRRYPMLRRAMTCSVLLMVPLLLAGCPSRSGDGTDQPDGSVPPDPTYPSEPGVLTITPNPIDVVLTGAEQVVPLTAESSNYGDVTQRGNW